MGYLVKRDYTVKIQDSQLSQIIQDDTIRIKAELTAVEQLRSYLIQKYDLTEEFKDTFPYDIRLSYNAGDRVELNFTDWSATTTYAADIFVNYQGWTYISTSSDNLGNLPTNTLFWQLIGQQYAIAVVNYPAPLFELTNQYQVGDTVWYKNKVYTCKVATTNVFEDTISYPDPYIIPTQYVYPDTKNSGQYYWGVGQSYALQAGVLPNDKLYWTIGDNRSAQLVQYCVDMTLYYILQRISPANIPVMRVKAYETAIQWLQMAAMGNVTANIPRLPENIGSRIRYGGNRKNINTY